MKKHLWKKRIALMICVLMVLTSMPSAAFAGAAQESTATDQTTEADQNKNVDQSQEKEKETSQPAKESTTEKAADTNTGTSEIKNTESKKESGKAETPKRKAVKFSANFTTEAAGETTTLKKTYKNPVEGVAKAIVQLKSAKDGYKLGDDLSVTFGVNLTLDEDYLYAENEAHTGDAGYPKFDRGDYNAYMQKVDEFLESLPAESLAPIVYTYDLGEDFTVPDGKKIEQPLKIKDDAGKEETLGTLIAEKQTDGHCVVTITFENKVYNRSGVAAGMTVGLEIDKDALVDGQNVVAGWKDDKIVVDVAGNLGPNDPVTPAAKDYTVEKTAKEKVDTPYIDYTINVDTKTIGKKLEGLILEDKIPADMQLISISKGSATLTESSKYSENTYKLADGTITYQFQEKTPPVAETEVSFQIRLALKDDVYKMEMADGSVDKPGIENTAKLYNADKSEEVAEAGTAETDMKFNVMSKNGKPEGMNGMRYAWTLDINTQFSEMTKSYIADVICFDDHRFNGDAGIGVYIDGKYQKTVKFAKKELQNPPAYENLKKGMYDQVVGNATAPFYYVYEKDKVKYAVLIIPFGSDYQNHKVQLKYYTDVWLGENADGSPITVDEWLHSHAGNLPKKNITNDAKFIWDRFIYGDGPGWDDFTWNVNLEKHYDTTVNLGSKSAGFYDEKTQMLDWKFIVNNYGAGMMDTMITDTLDPQEYNLDRLKLSYIKYDRKTGEKGSSADILENDGDIHYTLDKNTGKLTITMPHEIAATDYYEITMQIQVTDPALLSQQGTKTGFSNKAAFEAKVGGTDVKNEYTAKKDLTNTLITKKAVGNYDYDKKELAWQVGVDPNHIALTDLVVTDNLPAGNSFGELKTVTRVDKEGKKYPTDANLSSGGGDVTLDNGVKVSLGITEGTDAGYKKDKATFTFTGTGTNADYKEDSYIFDFTTNITDEDYLMNVFQGSDDVNVTNQVTLAGMYKGTPINGNANAEAVHAIKSGIITKNGEYIDTEGKISWNITFNQDKIDISGMDLIEDIGGQPLEIDDTSFVLNVKNSDGTTREYKKLLPNEFEDISNSGFTYKIPSDDTIKNQTLELKFDTYLTRSAEKADISNSVRLEKDGNTYQTSDTSDGGYDGSFDIDKYVTAAKNPILQVMKTSSNDEEETDKLPLAGAEFTAEAYGKTTNKNYNDLTEKYKKTGTTNENGKLNFVNLKKDYVYKLVETTAPAGYALDKTPKYYLFTDSKDIDADANGTENLTVGGDAVEVTVLKINQVTQKYPEDALTRTLNNTPKAGMQISFTKKDPLNQAFNSTGRKATFKLEYEKDWLAPKTIESDENGIITFDKVDPGKYTLTEIISDDPYDQGAVFNVEMKTNGDYTIKYKEGNARLSGNQGTYVIQNEYAKGTIKLKKVGSDSNNIPLEGAVFQLYDSQTDQPIKDKTAITGNDGIATFSGVEYNPNGYKIYEITPPDGYANKLPGESNKMPTLVKTIEKSNLDSALTAASNQDAKAKTFTLDFTSDTARVENNRTQGSITFKKVDSNNQPLSDRTFQLLYNDSDGYNDWETGHPVGNPAKTDSDGKLTFDNIPYGNYTLKEINPSGDNYQGYSEDFELRDDVQSALDTNRKDQDDNNDNTFSIDLGKIENKLLTTGFSIKKQDKTTEEVMKDVKFTLTGTDADGKLLGGTDKGITKSTGDNGSLTFEDIPIGAGNGNTPYVLTETQPTGYQTPTQYNVYVKSENKGDSSAVNNQAVVTIYERNADDTNGDPVRQSAGNYTLTNQPITGSLQFTKKDAADNTKTLSGAEFRLYRVVNGSPVTEKGEWTQNNPLGYHTAISDSNGAVKFSEVEYGNYQLKEITPPAGYKLWTGDKDITKNQLTVSEDTFTYTDSDAIKNTKTDLRFWKKDQFGNIVKGAKLALTGTFAGGTGEKTKTWESGEEVYDLAASLIAGNTYTLSETSAPTSGLYKKAADVTFKVAADGTLETIESKDPTETATYEYDKNAGTLTLIDAYYLAHVKLIKKDTEGNPLPGITFSLYQQNGAELAEGDTLIAENLTTGSDGAWTSSAATEIGNSITGAKLSEGLSNGTYYFKETATTDGYVLDTTPKSFTITAENDGQTVEKEITNAPVNASVELTKLDSEDDSGIANTTFTLTRIKDGSGETVDESGMIQTTASNGQLKFIGLQKGTYKLEETTANANYQPNEFACEFVVTDAEANQTLQINKNNQGDDKAFKLKKTQGTWNNNGVTNERKTGSVTLKKMGDINGTKKPLKGAEFTLYYADDTNKDKPVQKDGNNIVGTTDENGTFTIGDLAWAKYYLKETKVPAGYVVDESHLDFEIKAGSLFKGFQASGEGTADIINNATSFTIAKKADDGQQTGLKGAKFTIKGIFAGEEQETTRTFDMSAVDSQTIYQQLVTGQRYIVTETNAPAGYELDSKGVTVTVESDGSITVDGEATTDKTLTFRDKPIELTLHKTDKTGMLTLSGGEYRVTPASGSKFALRDGEQSISEISVTEANIKQQLSGRLIAGGSYVLTETKAPDGYAVAKPITFKVDEDGEVKITDGGDIAAVTATDPQTPAINLKDEKIQVTLKKVNADKAMLDGAIFTMKPDPASSGSKFAMIGDEETPPNSIDIPITLDKDGNLETQTALDGRLITGNRYTLSEKAQPSGYIKLQEDILVEVKAGEKLEIIPAKDSQENAAEILDEGKTIQITDKANKLVIKKQNDKDEALVTDDLQLQIKDDEDNVIKTLDKANQDADKAGQWTLNAQLTAGTTYTVTESKTPYGYRKADDVKFTMKDDGTVTVISGADQTANDKNSNNLYLTNGPTFIMRDVLIQGTVSLHKENSQGTALPGVKFDLYQMKGKEPDLTADNKINKEALTTDENGDIKVKDLGEGQYYFVETATLDDKLFDPTPTKILAIGKEQHQKTVSIDAVNKDFTTSIHLTKKDGEDGGAIAGTQFTLYKTVGGKDTAVTTATTDSKGDVTFQLTSKGDYKIVETKASKGYELKTDKPFTAKFSVENTKAFQGKTLDLTENPETTLKDQYHLVYENASFYEKTAAANQRILGKLTLKKADQADNKALDGAEFTLYKEKPGEGFEKVWAFITGNKYEPAETMKWSQQAADAGKITVSGLAWGNYYIEETKAADGYQLSKNTRYDFTIGRNANDITLTADAGTITNLQTRIEFTKMGKYIEACSDESLGAFSPDSLRPVAGAEFAISKKETPNTVIKTASSDANGKVTFYKLSPGTYCVKETKAPKGYLKDNTIYTVQISSTGECGGLTPMKGAGSLISGDKGDQIVNDVARGTIEIKKVSEQKQDQPIAGSVYGLYRKVAQSSEQPAAAKGKAASYKVAKKSSDTDGLQLIAKATTGKDGYLRFEGILMGVDYVIRELVAPAGSQVSEKPITIVFNLDPDTGKAVITHYEDGNGTAQIDPETGQIIWKEPSIMLSFDKKDEKGGLLKGAQLELQTKDGEVIASWTSSDKQAHMIYGDRMDGKIIEDGTYWLVETAAPEGYLTAKPVAFTVETKPTGPQEQFVQTITMVDKKKPVDASTPAQGTAGGGSAETGDDYPIQLWILLLLLSGGAIAVIFRKRNLKK